MLETDPEIEYWLRGYHYVHHFNVFAVALLWLYLTF